MSLADFSSRFRCRRPRAGLASRCRAAACALLAAASSCRRRCPRKIFSCGTGAANASLKFAWWVNGALVGIGFVVALVALFVLCVELLEHGRRRTSRCFARPTRPSSLCWPRQVSASALRHALISRVGGKRSGRARQMRLCSRSACMSGRVTPCCRTPRDPEIARSVTDQPARLRGDRRWRRWSFGGITFGVAEEASRRASMRWIKAVMLNSHGGRSIEAERITGMIRSAACRPRWRRHVSRPVPLSFSLGASVSCWAPPESVSAFRQGRLRRAHRCPERRAASASDAVRPQRGIRHALANQARPNSMWYRRAAPSCCARRW